MDTTSSKKTSQTIKEQLETLTLDEIKERKPELEKTLFIPTELPFLDIATDMVMDKLDKVKEMILSKKISEASKITLSSEKYLYIELAEYTLIQPIDE